MHQFRERIWSLRIVQLRVGRMMEIPRSSVMLSLLMEMPSSPTEIKLSVMRVFIQESGSIPSVFPTDLGLSTVMFLTTMLVLY